MLCSIPESRVWLEGRSGGRVASRSGLRVLEFLGGIRSFGRALEARQKVAQRVSAGKAGKIIASAVGAAHGFGKGSAEDEFRVMFHAVLFQ